MSVPVIINENMLMQKEALDSADKSRKDERRITINF